MERERARGARRGARELEAVELLPRRGVGARADLDRGDARVGAVDRRDDVVERRGGRGQLGVLARGVREGEARGGSRREGRGDRLLRGGDGVDDDVDAPRGGADAGGDRDRVGRALRGEERERVAGGELLGELRERGPSRVEVLERGDLGALGLDLGLELLLRDRLDG
ncbi:MAG: hypothetical protein ACTMID_13450, partial [Cellulosimicrobium funkei]